MLFVNLSFSSVCAFNSSFTAARCFCLRPARDLFDLLSSNSTEAVVGKLATRWTDDVAESSSADTSEAGGGVIVFRLYITTFLFRMSFTFLTLFLLLSVFNAMWVKWRVLICMGPLITLAIGRLAVTWIWLRVSWVRPLPNMLAHPNLRHDWPELQIHVVWKLSQ